MAGTLSEIRAEDVPNLKLLVQLLIANKGTDPLVKRGLLYSQIARLLTIAHENRLLSLSNESVEVTEEGREFLQTHGESRPRSDGGWISPQDSERIEKSADEDVYLPSKAVVRAFHEEDH